MTTSLRSADGFSMDDDEHQGDDDGQLAARLRVLEMFSMPRALRRRLHDDGTPEPDPGRERTYRDRKTGKFARRPEPEPIPVDDAILTLRHAQDAAAPKVGGAVANGRDVTGEIMRRPRPAPEPPEDDERAFEHSIEFIWASHGPACRCYQCAPYERPWWRTGRRSRQR